MGKHVLWLIARCLCVIACGLLALATLALYFEWPGGMWGGYAAGDYDRRLTDEARTALPIIGALQAYRAEQGDFPEHVSQFAPRLPASIPVAGEMIAGWHYSRKPDGAGFCLAEKLGWDPVLEYQFRDGTGVWIFAPGDGRPDVPVVLEP